MKRLALFSVLPALAFACSGHEPSPPADTGTDTGADVSADSLGCVPGLSNCGGVCYDLASDPLHCGTCDGVCDDDESCVDGACLCGDPLQRCGSSCVDPATDPDNCGGCGVACGDAELCQAGDCVVQCDEGLTACGGSCVDTASDMTHCGGCDLPCTAGENEDAACVDGGCDILCTDDWYDIDGADGCEYFCSPAAPGEEVCDGEDNDCNGAIDGDDEGYEIVLCPLQDGVCRDAFALCDGAGVLQECDGLAYQDAAGDEPYDAEFETWCDGVDNNCSGLADESCCGPEDLPVIIPEAELPLGWDTYLDGQLFPVDGAPQPMAIIPSLGSNGGVTRNIVSIAFFDGTGGHARLVPIANDELTVEGDLTSVYEALWNDELVVYARRGDGPVTRKTYDDDGVETSSVDVDGITELAPTIHEIRGRVLDDGTELLLVRASGATHLPYLVEVEDGVVTGSVAVSVTDTTLRLLDVVSTDDGAVACFERESLAPNRIRCVPINSAFSVGEETRFEAALPPEGRTRFAETESGWIIYLSNNDRDAAVRVEIDSSGAVTATETALRLVQGNILTGRLPTGEPAALTGEEHFDVDPPVFETTLLKPESGGSVVASYSAPAGIPLGFIYGDEATFITFFAVGGDEGERFGRAYAFRLSQDGAALCLE